MKKLLFIISLLTFLAFNNTNAQVANLVTNGDFEIYTTLPTCPGFIHRAVGWFYPFNPTLSSYDNGFGDYYYIGGFWPNSYTGYFYANFYCGNINPISGNGMAGIYTYGRWGSDQFSLINDFREYISNHLNSSIIPGKKYNVSFYLTNGNDSVFTYGCNNLAINFSINALQEHININQNLIIPVTPQIHIDTIVFLHNYWHQFKFKYIADSAYNYITIGNFKNNIQTLDSNFYTLDTYHYGYLFNSPYIVSRGAYYFIDKIEIYPALEIFGTPNICKGNFTTLKTNYDSIVIWKDTLHPNIIVATDTIITVSPTVTTTYMAISSLDTAYFTVNVYNPPIINLGNDTTLCQGETLFLDATTPNAVSYMWQDYSNNPTYTVTQAGTYWVKVMAAYCTARDTIYVAYKPLPIVNLGNDTTLCYGQTIILNATSPNATYQWQDGSTNSTFTVIPPYTPYTFWVKATVNNCSGYDTITISYIPTAITNFSRDTILCNGDSIILDVTNPNATYVWQDNTTNPTYNANQSGIYSVIITMDGCIFKDTIQVVISPPITINLGSDTTVCIGNFVILDPRNLNTTYQWQDGSSGSTYNVSQAGAYWVKVTDINKCAATDTINIYFTDCDTSNIIIPNIFTPNGDGYNDYFVIKQIDYKTIEVQIFDRWGIKVFEDNNYQNTWDGRYKGNPLSDGTYYYIIKSKGIYNNKVGNYHGSLTILR